MSRNAVTSAEQYSPFEHVPAGPVDPALADNSFREALAGAAATTVAFPAAVLAVSVPAVGLAGIAVVVALLVARATMQREEAHRKREATPTRSTESASTGTVPAAD